MVMKTRLGHRDLAFGFRTLRKKKKISLNLAKSFLPTAADDFHTVANITFLASLTEKLVCPWPWYQDTVTATLSSGLPTPPPPAPKTRVLYVSMTNRKKINY